MYSFLTVIFVVFIKLCLIQGHPQNYGGGRTGYTDRNIQNNNDKLPPQYDGQTQNTNSRYYGDGETISIGNGHNKKNVVIINESPKRNFQENVRPFDFQYINQRPRYDSKVVSINNIGNGRGNQNSVIIEDSPDGVGRTVTTFQNGFGSSSYDNQKFNDPSSNSYNHGTHNRHDRDPPGPMNRNKHRDESDFSYSQIGHGPDNHNLVIINGEVYSSPGTTVVRRKDNGFRKTEIISNNGYHSFPNDENLRELPKKKC